MTVQVPPRNVSIHMQSSRFCGIKSLSASRKGCKQSGVYWLLMMRNSCYRKSFGKEAQRPSRPQLMTTTTNDVEGGRLDWATEKLRREFAGSTMQR